MIYSIIDIELIYVVIRYNYNVLFLDKIYWRFVKVGVYGEGVFYVRLLLVMCYDIKNVEDFKVIVYDGRKSKSWILELDKCFGFWEIFMKVLKRKIFDF